MAAPVLAGSGGRFPSVEAALYAEYGIEIRVAWTFLTSQVEIFRIDGGPVTSGMFASFQRLWGSLSDADRVEGVQGTLLGGGGSSVGRRLPGEPGSDERADRADSESPSESVPERLQPASGNEADHQADPEEQVVHPVGSHDRESTCTPHAAKGETVSIDIYSAENIARSRSRAAAFRCMVEHGEPDETVLEVVAEMETYADEREPIANRSDGSER